MKKVIFTLLSSFCFLNSFAQPHPSGQFNQDDYAAALKAATLSISADKYLAETDETVMLTITIFVTDKDANPFLYDYRPVNQDAAPWKITQWKIVEGGGELKPGGEGNYFAALITPKQVPANKAVVVEATIEPNQPGYAKVILRQTIYIENNDNAFYINCPAYNINQEKWVIKDNGGLNGLMQNIPGSNPQLNEQLQKAMQQAQQAAQQKGYNMDALTSNCKAIYASDANVTTLTLNGGMLEQKEGVAINTKNNFMLVFSFPGQVKGNFKIKSQKEISASFTLPLTGRACGCADDPTQTNDKHPTCTGGMLYISEYKTGPGGFIKGTIYANLEGADGDHVIYADIQGKFKVMLAN